MAEALKGILGRDAVSWLADSLLAATPDFNHRGFAAACLDGLDALELKARALHIAQVMQQHLPQPFPVAAEIIARSLGPEVPATGENGAGVLRYMPHDCFIAQYGREHPEAAFRLQEELTKRCSCEFSIREFIMQHPEQTYAQLQQWAVHDNAHLRRLVSEGSRPRLPWAPRLPLYQHDPSPVIALLEQLKDDSVRYVQRSVANNINDISKDHADRAVALCRSWMKDPSPGRSWIIKHALRSLVKQGHPGALALIGAGQQPDLSIGPVTLTPARPKIGDTLVMNFDIRSKAKIEQDLLIDFAVHFMKANGKHGRKVFKLKRLSLEPQAVRGLIARIILADLTTRKHYPGAHIVELLVNGARFPLCEFELRK